MNPVAIRLRIDQLVLHGFSPHERHAVADALQRELAALLEARGMPGGPPASRDHDVLRTPQVTLPQSARPDQTGAAIARAIYRGLKG